MKISEQRISHLSRLVLDGLWHADLIDYRDEGEALNVLKDTFAAVLSVDDEVDSRVRQMLQKQRKVPGSREWQILYDKYFREEMNKRKW